MEKILGEIPFRPFSVLTITEKRIIGKRIIPHGPNRFEGEIQIENILNLKYSQASFLKNSTLTIVYKEMTGWSVTRLRTKVRWEHYSSNPGGISWILPRPMRKSWRLTGRC